MRVEDPSINFPSVLILFGAAQGLFFALILARMKAGNQTANRFLSALLLVFSLGLCDGFMTVTFYYVRYPKLIGLEWPLIFAYAPFFYFYVRSLTDPVWRIKLSKLILHLLPVILLFVYLIPFFFMNSETKARQWYLENSSYKNYSPIVDPILVLVLIQLSAYIVLSLRLLKKHSKTVQQNFSSVENINLAWLRNLILFFLCLLAAFIFFNFISQFVGLYLEAQYFIHILVSVFIYILAYRGMRQPVIFTALASLDQAAEDSPDSNIPEPVSQLSETDKYKKSSLTDEQAGKIIAKLTALMEKEKPYREMTLTLTELSDMLGVSSHHLSQVINEKLNKTFFDYVNEYRVRETRALLCSPECDRLSILGIAMDAGFNSKSAFYSAFKKHTGMTPSQFKKQNSASQSSPD